MRAGFNREGLMEYPLQIRGLLFGNWKWEEQGGEMTKVPYQPGTAFRARVNDDGTLSTLEDALAEIDQYEGVCVKVSGNVACIDLDDCILPDGTLTENAQKVLQMLPQAWVEVSPSGTGLHLFFTVPEGFSFDSSIYYINNRAVHMENYFPGSTNHFMSVTGNVYRKGSMLVTALQLVAFQDTFMKRPEKEASGFPVPEGGSIRRAGWIGDEFFPYCLKDGIVSQSDGNETERILAALKKEGSESEWMQMAAKVRTMPFARAMLAASFASPLLEKLQN